MDSGNLYPNHGANRITVPVQQQVEEATEQSQTVKALPILRDLITRFENRVKFYNTLDSIPEDVLTLPDEFMHLVAAHKLTGQMMQAELDYIKELVEDHAGN